MCQRGGRGGGAARKKEGRETGWSLFCSRKIDLLFPEKKKKKKRRGKNMEILGKNYRAGQEERERERTFHIVIIRHAALAPSELTNKN